MKRQARCHDTLRDRCTLPLAHDGAHRNGEHTWDFRDVPVAPWRRNLTARDDTRAMLTGAPL